MVVVTVVRMPVAPMVMSMSSVVMSMSVVRMSVAMAEKGFSNVMSNRTLKNEM